MNSCLRLFVSIDVIGSTALKNASFGKQWTLDKVWFTKINRTLLEVQQLAEAATIGLSLVKAIGDELLLTKILTDHAETRRVVKEVVALIREYNHKSPLKIKGCVWIAGFPVNNSIFQLKAIPEDYIGPSMDAGFRIAKHSTKRKMVISVDLALIVTHHVFDSGLTFYYDGAANLQGVLGGGGYPVIWIETEGESEEEKLVGVAKTKCDQAKLHSYCEAYIKSKSDCGWLIRPYYVSSAELIFNEKPQSHIDYLKSNEIEDHKATSPTVGETEGSNAPLSVPSL